MYEDLVKSLRTDHDKYFARDMEVADAIESACKAYQMMAEAYEREVTKQEWIPVTERLPKKHERVLVCSKSVKMRIDFINNDGKWYTTPHVTHWMPLPEPPKEET